MKIKFTTIVAGTILAITAVTGAILPASAIGTNPVVQQTTNGKTPSLLLAAGGKHTKNRSQSNKARHEAGEATKKAANERKNPEKKAEEPVKETKAQKKEEAQHKKNVIKGYKSGSPSVKN